MVSTYSIYLNRKGRHSHLLRTGSIEDDLKFEAWDKDFPIMSWLWDLMDLMISDACMFLGTARGIWEYARRNYSKVNNATQVYAIKVKTAATKHENKSVTEYGSMLQNLWEKLYYYRVFEMKSPEDASILKRFIKKDLVGPRWGE